MDSLGEFLCYVNLDLYSCTEKSGVCEEEGRGGGKRKEGRMYRIFLRHYIFYANLGGWI